MGLAKTISIVQLESIQGGMTQFYTPQSSHETVLVQVPAGTVEDLFVHRFQTDQLLAVRGSCVLAILENRQYRYIPLSENKPQVLTIPTGVLHGVINVSDIPCFVVNAVLRHGKVNPRDYQPRPRPFPYDLKAAQTALDSLNSKELSPLA